MSEFELVVGREYKVRLKPLEELLSTGMITEGELGYPWFKSYLSGNVGVMVFRDGDFQVVDWEDGSTVLWHYFLPQLKILGEV